MKKYLVPLVLTVALSGCGKDLDYVSLDTTTTTATLETEYTSCDTSVEPTQTPTTDASETALEVSDTTTVTESSTVTTVATTVETTAATTTNILSSYGSDAQLIELANALYLVACETYWNYYDGTPYPLDYDEYVEVDAGTYYFLVDDESVTSLEDVQNHWFEIFSSDSDPGDFDGRFIERDGRVYASDGGRGANVFYTDTEVTEIVSVDDGEVTFRAVSHYANPEDGSSMDDEEDEFSIVLEDGAYHVGAFTLPY